MIIKDNTKINTNQNNYIPTNNNKNNYTNSNINLYKNINNKQESLKDAYSIIEDRYKKGLISLEDFTKQCNNIKKKNN